MMVGSFTGKGFIITKPGWIGVTQELTEQQHRWIHLAGKVVLIGLVAREWIQHRVSGWL